MQMAEPTCLMRSFSQPSEISRDYNQEGDPSRCLGESISFGRYMSEPLAWEKWSTFSSNRYLEEAEKYSKPGSVAKMKAYFESYYKTIASKKRAAKDEEATRATNYASCSDSATNDSVSEKRAAENDSVSEKPINDEDCNLELNSSFTAPTIPLGKEEDNMLEDTEYIAPVISLDDSVQLQVQCSDDLERQPSNELEQSKCTPDVESFKEGDDLEKLNSKMEKSPTSLEMEPSKKCDDDQERLNKKMKKLPDSNSRIPPPPYCKPPKLPTSSVRVVTSHHPTKEGCATPSNKQQAKDALHLNALPSTSLNKSIKFGPHTDVIRKSSRIVLKSLIDNPLMPSAKNKILKDKSTPLQTPNRASVAGKPKLTSATPQSEIGRSKATPGRSLSRGRARELDLQLPSLNNMKPSTTSSCVLKARASITFSPFNFRTEERAAKRREFFLKKQEKEDEKTKQLEKTKQEQVKTASKLLHTIGLKPKPVADSNTTSSRQETCTHPQPRPLKKSDTLRRKDGKHDLLCDQSTILSKKIRHENDSPNIL